MDGKHHDVYFTERFTRGPEGASIAFDYRLRPGLAKTTNALKLMEIVGLPVDGVTDAPGGDGEAAGYDAEAVAPRRPGDEVAGLESDAP